MAAAFGVRLTACGPNRQAVLAKARLLMQRPPAEVKAAVLIGQALVVASDVGRASAESVAAEFLRLGAVAEVFLSTPCPSDAYGHTYRAKPDPAAGRSGV